MKIKIIAHTHWDREWYFTHLKSLVYALHDFDEIIEFLENNPQFSCFLLDGQTSIVEEYLKFHPQMESRLKALVAARRVLIGPWYTQTDTMVIGGESIVRNLLYGTQYAEKMGHSMQIGYLPDSFGMNEQMPQIYRGFRLSYAMFRRGICDDITTDREFYWQSPDGSVVFTHNIYHYGSMAYPPEASDEVRRFTQERIELLKDSSKTGTIVLFNGEDQKPIRKNLLKIIDNMNLYQEDVEVSLDNPENIMAELERSEYPFITYQGEFTWGQHSRVHKSIFSTRADLKIQNNRLENYLVNILEPLLTMGHILGLSYEAETVRYVWENMLENAAHDSIGMCNSDKTNRFIAGRYQTAEELACNLIELKQREIAGRIPAKNIYQFQVYNLLPYVRTEAFVAELYLPAKNIEIYDMAGNVYDYQIEEIEEVTEKIRKLSIRETGVSGNINPQWLQEAHNIYRAKLTIRAGNLPKLGYRTLFIRAKEGEAVSADKSLAGNPNTIENEYFKISYHPAEQFVLEVKATKERFKNFLYLQEDGDEGDSYDYSQPSEDLTTVRLEEVALNCRFTKLRESLVLKGLMPVPENLKSRAAGLLDSRMPIKLELSLESGQPIIRIKAEVNNRQIEHRVRLVLNTGISAQRSVADEAFGTIERPVVLGHENWRIEGWDEKPRTIEPMMSYVALRSPERTFQMITKAVREYQIIGDDYSKIALTLFRTTPKLGKADLNDRPGRESGNTTDTFDTRMLNKTIAAEYAIAYFSGAAGDFQLAQTAKRELTPIVYYQGAEFKNNTEHLVLNGSPLHDLPLERSFIDLEGEVILSAFKKAEASDDVILRLFNPDRKNTAAFQLHTPDSFCWVNLKEEKDFPQPIVRTGQVQSLMLFF